MSWWGRIKIRVNSWWGNFLWPNISNSSKSIFRFSQVTSGPHDSFSLSLIILFDRTRDWRNHVVPRWFRFLQIRHMNFLHWIDSKFISWTFGIKLVV
jgi:hypothetical protein